MGKGWYKLSEMISQHGYSRHYLMQMYYKPGQRYAKKLNPAAKNSPVYFNLEAFRAAEAKEMELQAKSRERRAVIA